MVYQAALIFLADTLPRSWLGLCIFCSGPNWVCKSARCLRCAAYTLTPHVYEEFQRDTIFSSFFSAKKNFSIDCTKVSGLLEFLTNTLLNGFTSVFEAR